MAVIRNMIGGKVEQISWDQLIESAPMEVRTPLCDMGAREGVDGIVVFVVQQMDSSSYGNKAFLAFGPGCTHKTLDSVTAGRLGDVPSRFAYPVLFWTRLPDADILAIPQK